MALSKADIEERLDKGSIQCLVTLQVVGKPEPHVEKSLDQYLDMINEEEAIEVLNKERFAAEELDDQDGFFSAIAEVEMLVPNLRALTQVAFNLTPGSIEILEPQEFVFQGRHLQNWLNDLLSMLHSMAATNRGERQKNAALNRAVSRISRNFVAVLLTSGPKDMEQLQRMTGIGEEVLTKILAEMEEEGVATSDGDTWTLKSSEK